MAEQGPVDGTYREKSFFCNKAAKRKIDESIR